MMRLVIYVMDHLWMETPTDMIIFIAIEHVKVTDISLFKLTEHVSVEMHTQPSSNMFKSLKVIVEEEEVWEKDGETQYSKHVDLKACLFVIWFQLHRRYGSVKVSSILYTCSFCYYI